MSLRRLTSSNIQAFRLCLSEAKTKIEDHKIFPKLKQLIDSCDYLSRSDFSIALRSTGNQLYQIFIKSKNNCRQIRAGLATYSPNPLLYAFPAI